MRPRSKVILQVLLTALTAAMGSGARGIPTPMAAAAPESPARAAVDAHALGLMEGMLKYCARVDAKSVEPLQYRIRMIAGNASTADVLRARESSSYRAAFDAVGAFVEKVDERNAARPCIEALQRRPSGQNH